MRNNRFAPTGKTVGESPRGLGRRFWTVWTAGTASNIGDGVVVAALPLLAATLTREPVAIALTTIAVRLPWLVFGLFAGVIADRVDRLRLMVITDVARALAFAAMLVIVAGDHMTLTVLYVTVFGIGILETLFDTASMSMTPSLVRRDQLDVANARISGSQIVANEFVGPPLGGLLFVVGVSIPFGVNAVTFAVSAALLLTVGGRYRPHRSEPTTVIEDIRFGFGFVWREPVIRAFAIGAGVVNLGFTAAAAILVLHAQDNLGLDGFGFGVLLTSGAIGGLLGAQLAPRTIERIGRRTSVLASVLVLSGGVAVIGAAHSLLVAAIGFAAFGFAGEIWNIVSISYRQAVTPDVLLGRVMSSFRVIAYGAFPIGAAVGGLTASATSLRTTIYIGAAIIAALLPYLAIATAGRSLQPDQHDG